MKTKTSKTAFIRIMAATTALSLLPATQAFAKTPAANEVAGFKIAVINGSAGSANIISGDYQKGLEEISTSYSGKTDISYAWEYEFGLCAANLKMEQLEKAESACSRAITTMPRQMKRTRQGRYLHSVALSNRGIVRYISADVAGALADFNSAMAINENSIVKQNLSLLTNTLLTNTLLTNTLLTNTLTLENNKGATQSFAAVTNDKSISE
ncbi:hypothetical protein SG34_023105 [Thalassomonas viridans]|uniref:Uncharacterized protein n=1 Tax=Thalassomonas viridans TaxID=137584 RepID=A0AAE9Z2V8_9GAMM|nr:hypothetical protein [Thalassomonas viridans]WDE04202.1 hypothetical protein SG34_023105 [Thalassomonas viridans]